MNVNRNEDCSEPVAKKVCLTSNSDEELQTGETSGSDAAFEKLEKRLSLVLRCTVCLDLPKSSILQCVNGHLMCVGCLSHLLADARLRNEMASCPNCRTDITESLCTRNLAVEKAVSELPIECKFCNELLPRFYVDKHENEQCIKRVVSCKYKKIGCVWQGAAQLVTEHEGKCAEARKTGFEIMEGLEKLSRKEENRLDLYRSLFALLSYGKTCIHDIQLQPRRSEDYLPQLYYQSSRFSSFGKDWMVKSQIVGNENCVTRSFTFQLILSTRSDIFVKFVFVRSPLGDVDIEPTIFQHEFTQDSTESLEHNLPISKNIDINKLLAARIVPVRLVMFLGKS